MVLRGGRPLVEEEGFLHLVEVLVEGGETVVETLALTAVVDDLEGLGAGLEGVHVEDLPVVKDALREGLARGVGAEVSGEAEGLHDGEVSLDLVEGSSSALVLGKDVSTSSVEDSVDTTHGVLGALDVDEVDGLEETGLSGHLASVEATTHGGDELTTSAVDSVGVEGNIVDAELDSTHVLVAENTLLGGPLEGSSARVLNLVKVLDSLGGIDEDVGSGTLGSEAPELTALSGVPAVLVGDDLRAGLDIVTGVDLTLVDVLGESLREGLSLHEQTVVLVGRLGQTHLVRLGGDGLTVRDDGGRGTELEAAVLLLKILETDLNVELTGTSNDVLTTLLSVALDARVRLGKTTETLDELGEVRGVLGLDGDADDGGDGELHDTNVVGRLLGGDGSGLDEELIDTDEGDGVTGGDIFDGLDVTSHHEDGTLDVLDKEIVLLAGNVVGTHDADLLASADGTREDTTKGVETTLIGGGHHLGDVEHEGAVGVAVADTLSADVIEGTLVEELDTVLLGLDGRGEVDDNHLEEGVGSGEELAHDGLEEGLLAKVLLLRVELDVKGGDHLLVLLGLELHDRVEELVDGAEDELAVTTLEGLSGGILGALGPLLGGGVKEVVTPEALHELVLLKTELLGVHVGEAGESETPSVETTSEGDGTGRGVDLELSHHGVLVRRDDDVDGLNGTGKVLVSLLLGELELKEGTVELVDHDDGADTLDEGLAKHSLGLDAHSLDAVDDDEGSISDTEGSSDLRGEVDVAWGINKVDQETSSVSVDLRGDISGGNLVKERDTSRLDGNAAVLLVGTGVHVSGLSGVLLSNDTSLANQRVGQGRLSVVDAIIIIILFIFSTVNKLSRRKRKEKKVVWCGAVWKG